MKECNSAIVEHRQKSTVRLVKSAALRRCALDVSTGLSVGPIGENDSGVVQGTFLSQGRVLRLTKVCGRLEAIVLRRDWDRISSLHKVFRDVFRRSMKPL